MSFDYCGPESPLGEKINCITLTKDFFEKHNINSVKDNLTRNFLSFRGVPIQYMNQVHGKNYEFISSRSLTPIESLDCLLHSSEVSHLKISNLNDMFAVGEKIKVKILEIDTENMRMSLSVKAMLPDPFETIKDKFKINKDRKSVV